MLVGHSAIRKVCAENGLGILLSNDFYYGLHTDSTRLACFKRQLKMLADTSGYSEIANAPILPIGESARLANVKFLQDFMTSKCIATACIKNIVFPNTKNGK